MTAPLVLRRSERAIDFAVIDSPSNRNALSIAMMTELLDVLSSTADGDGRALVIDHTGSVFCPGVDLKERRASTDDSHSRTFADLLRALWSYPKPIIARVDGAARGGGMAILACCDMVVASRSATFAYSEVRVGVAPALVLAVTAPMVALRPLAPWMLTGRTFDSPTALTLGLVSRIAEDADVTVAPECEALREAAPGAVRITKQLTRQHAGATGTESLDAMEAASVALFQSAEASEGMAAFAGRRAPAWTVGADEQDQLTSDP